MRLSIQERDIDLTELYVADEVFACGTSAYIAPVVEIDARAIGTSTVGPITAKIQKKYLTILQGNDIRYASLLTNID